MGAEGGPASEAAAAAFRGELIVFPTDTVYGIGTRPDDPDATACCSKPNTGRDA